MKVLYQQGIYLPDGDLWLDPHKIQRLAVVTHGHSDHIHQHAEVYSTAITAAMMRLRRMARCRYHEVRFGEPFELGGAQVTLYPAGHILGSAQVLVERNGVRLLYSGDFKLRPGRSVEPIEVPRADIVIMETTWGRPRYRLPDADGVFEEIREFCRTALNDGYTPVLLTYSLGKGQEVLARLEGGEFPIYLQEAHWNMASLYRNFGVSFPKYEKYQPGQKLDGVLLCAPGCRNARWWPRLKSIRTAYISGWALDKSACWRFRTDAAFPLSDHADYDELLEYVELTGAEKVYTVHGYMAEFAADLRTRGYWAEPLQEPGPQLSLF